MATVRCWADACKHNPNRPSRSHRKSLIGLSQSSAAMSRLAEAFRYWKFRLPQSESMITLRIQMHLHWNAGIFKCNVVNQRVPHVVLVVVFSVQQERWRRLFGDVN